MRDPLLDDISAELGEVLRSADRLLDEWQRFGASVRAQVEREAATIGDAVASAVDGAIERAIVARFAPLASEMTRLEQRARAASRAIAEQRTSERRWLAAIAAGIAIAIVLLGVLVARGTPPAPSLPAAVPTPIVLHVDAGVPTTDGGP